VDARTLARIFAPFFTRKFAGRGPGLAAVLGIAQRHGGALRVRSRPGAGTSFSVRLPAREGNGLSVSDPGPRPPAAWCGSGKLLLVDDAEAVRSVASRMLTAMGFEVLVAGGGRESLEVLNVEANRIRAVLLDLSMPHLDGEATLRSIRQVMPDLPVVLVTGYDVSECQERFSDLGFDGFLQKPFRVADLSRAVRGALGE
jgi:CheY-like chemotaxis protein